MIKIYKSIIVIKEVRPPLILNILEGVFIMHSKEETIEWANNNLDKIDSFFEEVRFRLEADRLKAYLTFDDQCIFHASFSEIEITLDGVQLINRIREVGCEIAAMMAVTDIKVQYLPS